MRDTLIIGHANPEDNNFTLWLSSRLLNEGYNVFSDISNLQGGEEDFWEKIQITIKEKAIKYVLVLSSNTFNKSGVKDEWEYARSIAKDFDMQDFIIPLRIDKVSYNERIGLNRINIIDFSETWREGFLQLIKKLNNDEVPKTNSLSSVYDLLNSSVNIYNSLNNIPEQYYTNVLPFEDLPEFIFIFKYHHSSGAEAVRNEIRGYPISVSGNLLFSFEESIPTILTKRDYIELIPKEIIKLSTEELLSGQLKNNNYDIGDPLNALKVLLRNAFRDFMFSKGLVKYEMSNKKFCYYYKINTIENNKFSYLYRSKKKTKNLIGTYSKKMLNSFGQYEAKEFFWHFGITCKISTSPLLCCSVKTHIIFSDDGVTIWDSDAKLHTARRDKCKMWHNAEWRDILLAYLYSLGNLENKLEIPVTNTQKLKLNCQPMTLNSSVGYFEPSDFQRMFLLRNEIEEDEEMENESEGEEDVEN